MKLLKKQKKNILLSLGFGIVILSHIYILIAGLPQDMVNAHAIVNLVGAGLIVAGHYMK